jgi:hypothetical protein
MLGSFHGKHKLASSHIISFIKVIDKTKHIKEYMDEEEQQTLHESIKEEELKEVEDEVGKTCFDDKNNQVFISPPHEDNDLVTCTPFQNFGPFDASFDNLEREEGSLVDPSFHEEQEQPCGSINEEHFGESLESVSFQILEDDGLMIYTPFQNFKFHDPSFDNFQKGRV